MHETRALAQFVAQTQFTDLPASLVQDCKIMVLDALGAGFVGSMQPWAQRAVDMVRELSGPAAASVIHQEWRTARTPAALCYRLSWRSASTTICTGERS